jgi:hypothetical protein
MSWRPLFPIIDAQFARLGQILGVCLKAFKCFGGGNDLKAARLDIRDNWEAFLANSSMDSFLQGLGLAGSGDLLKIFKILTSYFQVFLKKFSCFFQYK